MSPRLRRAFSIAVISASVGACTTVEATRRGAVAYNRAFNDARNQILLLNILRARDHYPQQFSTISSVTGGMRPEMSVTGALENIILGGAEVFKPSGTLGLRNPAVTISPLETKEFRKGMMSPVQPDFVGQLLAQGWTPGVVWHLVAKSVGCGAADSQLTTLNETNGWAITRTGNVPIRTIVVPANEGAKILREGAGVGLTVKLDQAQTSPDQMTLKIERPGAQSITLAKGSGLCSSVPIDKVVFRSPEGMIQFLGAQLRPRRAVPHRGEEIVAGASPYFEVRGAAKRAPLNSLVATQFNRQVYYILEEDRLSLETLALLAEIIGFQTMDATLSKPTLTVAQ